MSLHIVQSPSYDANFSPDHRFPMGKYTKLAHILTSEGLAPHGFHIPGPADADTLALAHDRGYVENVIACSVPEKIEKLIGFPVTERVSRRARCATTGTIMAARLALEDGIACNAAGGSHHARRAHGAGFCTFNDVGVCASLLLKEKAVRKVLVFDCDVHQGDGTAEIFAGEDRVFTVSIHAEKNYPTRKATSNMDVALPDKVRDDAYLEIVEDTLERALDALHPDIVFYNAGVDPHGEDRLGRLDLTNRGLFNRDEAVIGFFREKDIPVCGVIGGGYGKDVDAIAERHAILFRVASHFAR